MRMVVLIPLVAALTGAGSPGAAQSAAGSDKAAIEADLLRPGDLLRITVWRKPELSGEFQVAADGTVAGPYYMDVNVGGVRLAEAASRIRAHVLRYETQPQVLVEPLLRVGVFGEVQRPSLYTLSPSTTLVQAMLSAGGPTERGDLQRAWLYRAGDRLRVNLGRPGDAAAEGFIRSGDYIVVDRRRAVLKEYVLPALLAVGAASSIARFFGR